MSELIFCVGDSRTGTTSLHRYLQALGLRSIHFPVKAAQQLLPLHENAEQNWGNFREFIDSGKFQAFSDYPTPFFYKELIAQYPSARYILTVRKDLKTWQQSMETFFGKLGEKIDLEELTTVHVERNNDIIELLSQQPNQLLLINIDADAEENSKKIKEFLGVESDISLGWENKSVSRLPQIWSKRVTLYDTPSSDYLRYIEALCAPDKAMLSEFGWIFPINDDAKFLHYQYGFRQWSQGELTLARDLLVDRHKSLSENQSGFLHFVIPEKSIVYPEFLPRRFETEAISESRPARQLENEGLGFSYYLADYLKDAKSYGQLYFRGDTSPTWTGSYLIYHFIVERLNESLGASNHKLLPPVSLRVLVPSLAAYTGTLEAQLSNEFRDHLDLDWGNLHSPSELECLVKYQLSDRLNASVKMPSHAAYSQMVGQGKVAIRANSSPRLPSAVIFCSPMSDFLHDLLSQHFSRCVFVSSDEQILEDIIREERPHVVLQIVMESRLYRYPMPPAS